MDEIKVNKITVNVDTKECESTISLYKTNQLICRFKPYELGLKEYDEYNVSIKAYQLYVKDYMINLISNGGISGLYYEEKQSNSIKYDMQTFRNKINDYIKNTLGDIKYRMNHNDIEDEMERYSNKFIKNATVRFGVSLLDSDISFSIVGNIKSGQLCRPRIMVYNDDELQFNITTIKRLVKGNI